MLKTTMGNLIANGTGYTTKWKQNHERCGNSGETLKHEWPVRGIQHKQNSALITTWKHRVEGAKLLQNQLEPDEEPAFKSEITSVPGCISMRTPEEPNRSWVHSLVWYRIVKKNKKSNKCHLPSMQTTQSIEVGKVHMRMIDERENRNNKPSQKI